MAASGYQEAAPGYRYSFPRDHFSHPAFRTEWWYYTGNVHDAMGKRFGFELVFFRAAKNRGQADNRSAWRMDDVYLAHAALTHIDGRRFEYAERLNRAGPGIAGIDARKGEVWNGNWAARWDGENQNLTALADGFEFNLHLEPGKPLVIHGLNGLSQKAEGPGKASYYVSFTNLKAQGSVRAGKDSYQVSGVAWMDHEWFTEQLAESEIGWDWFSIQLEDNTELMLFDLRRKDGTIDPYSSGTFVDGAGKARHLTSAEFSLRPVEYWTSAKSKARYPVRWKVSVPALRLDVDCVAAVKDQELITKVGNSSYWEGAVGYEGSKKGLGYLEMTGYDKPLRLP